MEEDIQGIIYCFTNKVNGKCYVGCTTEHTKKGRFSAHWAGTSRATAFNLAMKKYGRDSFEQSIIEDSIKMKQELHDRERYWIATKNTQVPNGYNITSGGEVGKQFKQTEETKRKIKENSAKIWLGKHLSEETKQRIRDARAKQAPFTEEQLKKKSESLKKAYAEGRKIAPHSKALIRLDTMQQFNSAVDVERLLRFSSKVINKLRRDNDELFYYKEIPFCTEELLKEDSKDHLMFLLDEKYKTKKKMRCHKAVRCIETGKEYVNMCKASQDVAGVIKDSCINKAIKDNKIAYGYHWEYV